jgi:CarD family transcriptional regulator
MLFEVGEMVVYPHHGAATITEVKTRTLKGEAKLSLTLGMAQGDYVFEVVRAPFTEEATNWSRRFTAHQDLLASGEVIKMSEVVRDLWRRDQDRGLSAGEKSMPVKARQILVSELGLAEKTDEEKASTVLDEVLAS